MVKIRHILTLLMISFMIIEPALSQNLNDTLRLDEIKIEAKQINTHSITVTRIDSLALQSKTGSSLTEVLAEHSSIYIKTYGRGAMASASFRGTDPSHTKVLWNGIELNSPMLGMLDFSLIPVFLSDNVELLHGSGSITESAGAFGGLISLSTKPDWNNKFSGSFLQGVASFGSHDEHLRFSIGSGKMQLQTRIFYAHSDNDFSFYNKDIIDSIDLETGEKYHPRMKNQNADFTFYGILQEIHYRPSKNDFLNFSFWAQEASRSIPLISTNETGLNNSISRQNDNSIRGQVSYRHYGNGYDLKFFSGLNSADLDYSRKSLIDEGLYYPQISSTSLTYSIYNSLTLKYDCSESSELEVSTGIDYHKVNSLEKLTQLGYNESRVQTHISAGYFQRWNSRLNSKIKAGAEFINTETAMPYFLAGSEYHILPDDRLYLKMSIASNSKFPSLNDLYYQPGGNPDLKPERSFDQEIGLHFSTGKNGFTFEQDISAYMSQVHNWIMWQYRIRGFSPVNIEKVDIKGLETTAGISFKNSRTVYKLSGSYSFTHSRDLGNKLGETDNSYGKQLPYIPVHSANLMFYVLYKNWNLNYIWNFYSKRYTTTSNEEYAPGDYLTPYFMNQIGIGKQMNFKNLVFDLNFKVFNLFNEEYRSVLQRPMPGRNFSLQVKIGF